LGFSGAWAASTAPKPSPRIRVTDDRIILSPLQLA
jgi:hypothetical protein